MSPQTRTRQASPLLAGPGTGAAAGRLVVPGRAPRVGGRVENGLSRLALRRVGPTRGQELKEARRTAGPVNGQRVVARFALGDAKGPGLGRGAERGEGVQDDLLD